MYGTDPLRNVLPDLMLTWDRSRPFTGIEIPGVARFMADPQSVRTGDHRPGGLVMLAGTVGHNTRPAEPIDSSEIAHHLLAIFDVAGPARPPRPVVAEVH